MLEASALLLAWVIGIGKFRDVGKDMPPDSPVNVPIPRASTGLFHSRRLLGFVDPPFKNACLGRPWWHSG